MDIGCSSPQHYTFLSRVLRLRCLQSPEWLQTGKRERIFHVSCQAKLLLCLLIKQSINTALVHTNVDQKNCFVARGKAAI